MAIGSVPSIESLESRQLLSTAIVDATLVGEFAKSDIAITSLRQAGSLAYFSREVNGVSTVWVTDGSTLGSHQLIASKKPDWVIATAHGAYFGVNETLTVYFTDNTAAGTHAVGSLSAALANPSVSLAVKGDQLAIVDPQTQKVVISDGTSITPLTSNFNHNVLWVASFNDHWYFRSSTAVCVSDGTSPGTSSVLTIAKLPNEVAIFPPLVSGGKLWFSRAGELYTSDASLHTARVQFSFSLDSDSGLTLVSGLKNGIVFTGELQQGDIGSKHLFFTDGTITTDLGAAGSVETASNHRALTIGSTLYFAETVGHDEELYSTDGTLLGTGKLSTAISSLAGVVPENFVELSGYLYFTSGHTVMRTNNTRNGTKKLATLSNEDFEIASVGGNILFERTSAQYDDTIFALHRGDGSPQPVLRDVPDTTGSAHIAGLVERDGKIFFSASTSQPDPRTPNVTTMYVTQDGHTAPLLTSSHGFGFDPNVKPVATFKGIFMAGTTTKPSLWLLDGDHNNGLTFLAGNFRSISDITGDANGGVFFAARTNTNGYELWKSDGTVAGTVMVKDIVTGTHSSTPANLTLLRGGKLVFIADDGIHGRELWITNGTSSGTTMVKDVRAGSQGGFALNQPFSVFKGIAYSAPYSTNLGYKLWRSDGTSGGTFVVTSQSTSLTTDAPGTMISSTRGLFFSTVANPSLYVSDGSGRGTRRLITLSAKFKSINQITPASFQTFFVGTDKKGNEHLFSTDGTVVGTHEIRVPAAVNANVTFSSLTAVGNEVFFTLGGSVADGMYRTDILAINERVVDRDGENLLRAAPPLRFNDQFFFDAATHIHGEELWQLDI